MSIDEQWDQSGLVGKLVAGRYMLAASLHTSARSEVFEAEHVELGQRFALKILRAHPAAAALAAHASGSKPLVPLVHDGIVDITDVGRTEQGELYVVSELKRGTTLRKLVGDNALTARRVVAIVRQLLEALQAAHAAGIVHRNVCPEHVIVVRENNADRVFLLGAPLARFITAPPDTFAEPSYLAPEAASGKPADARSDLYAVGALLFELLTGHPVFHGTDRKALARLHAYAAPQTLQQRAPEHEFPAAVEQLVARALEKQPHKRFASASEMLAALDDAARALDEAAAAAPSETETETSTEPVDDSLLQLGRDLMPAAAPSAPEPIVPINIDRRVLPLPWTMRLRKRIDAMVRRFRRLPTAAQVAIGASSAVLVVVLGSAALPARTAPAVTSAPQDRDVGDAEAMLERGNPKGAARLLDRYIPAGRASSPRLTATLKRIIDSGNAEAAAIARRVAGRLKPPAAELLDSSAAPRQVVSDPR